MATRLDTAANAAATTLAYSISAGNNRCLIVGAQMEGTLSGNIGASYGGQTMSLVRQEIAGSGTTQQTVALFYLNDAGIVSAANTNVIITNLASVDQTVHARSYQDVVQTTPTNTDSDTSGAATPNPLANCDIVTSNANAVVVSLSGMGNAGTAAWGSTMTEQTQQADSSSTGSLADDEVPSPTTIACDCTWTTQNRAAIVALELEDLQSGPTIESGVYSANGVATDSIVGQSTAQASYSSDGVATDSIVGQSTAQASYSSDGTAATNSIGVEINLGTYSSNGNAVTNGVGIALKAGVYFSAGNAITSGTGQSEAQANYSSDGTVTTSGIGQSTAQANYSSDGTATTSGIGQSIAEAVYSSDGTATTSGIGQSIAEAVYSSDGTATTVAQASGYISGDGEATGNATVNGIGQGISVSSYSSDGAATTNGAGLSIGIGVASSDGVSTTIGIGQSTAKAYADGYPASSIATGIGQSEAQANYSSDGIATTLGDGNSIGVGVASASGTAISNSIGIGIGVGIASASGTSIAVSDIKIIRPMVAVAQGTSTAEGNPGAASGSGLSIGTSTAQAEIKVIFAARASTYTTFEEALFLTEDDFFLITESGLNLIGEEVIESGGPHAEVFGIGSISQSQSIVLLQEIFLINLAISDAIKEHKRTAIINSDTLINVNGEVITATPITIDNGYAEQYYEAWKTFNTDYERRYNMEQVELLFTKLGYNISKQDNNGRLAWKVQW